MAKRSYDVSDAELGVLEVLWDRGRSTIRELTVEIYEDASFSKYQSIQKLVDRLEKKACVKRRRSKPAHTFEACVHRETLIGHRLEGVAERLCGGSLTPLLMHLVGRTKLDPVERDLLQKLIDSHKS